MAKLPITPLMLALGESFTEIPTDLRWWVGGLTVAIIAFILALPTYIRHRIETELEERKRRLR